MYEVIVGGATTNALGQFVTARASTLWANAASINGMARWIIY
jgi:hypothetical protein